jgi:hypothetical protein
MRLSDAMRLGSMTGSQTIGALARGSSTCALGAAYVAAGLFTGGRCTVPLADALKTFPALRTPVAKCPWCSFTDLDDVRDAIVHLNDFHMWTRERIADWVDTVERSLEEAAHHDPDKRVVSLSAGCGPSQRAKELSFSW